MGRGELRDWQATLAGRRSLNVELVALQYLDPPNISLNYIRRLESTNPKRNPSYKVRRCKTKLPADGGVHVVGRVLGYPSVVKSSLV
jgi:hypothetical protein